ncbi:MAG: cytochrome c-type biogenesis protein CcmH [Rhodospirillales bacterium]|nr:cytochrome c-type biogenesis protein CcmH [Rhodospirillales bacterium]
MTRRAILPALALASAIFFAPDAARAVLPQEMLPDPALEARARDLSREIRCQVCQNQSIDDSNAPLAADLRRLVRERLVAGDSDREVFDFLVRRYGDYVLLRPPMRPGTWPLWFGPGALLILGAAGVVVYFRRRRRALSPAPAALNPEEQRRVAHLLNDRPEA